MVKHQRFKRAYIISAIQNVWNRMKACAAEQSGLHPAGRLHAEALIARFMSEENVSPWPPPQVIEFFARELREMMAQGSVSGELTDV